MNSGKLKKCVSRHKKEHIKKDRDINLRDSYIKRYEKKVLENRRETKNYKINSEDSISD